MLIATTIIIWIIALALPSPKRYRKRQTTRAAPEKLPTLPDPDEIQFLLTQREQLFTIAAEIDELPDGIAKKKKQIAIDKQIFAVDKKLKRLYN